jgi:hypothetical protein
VPNDPSNIQGVQGVREPVEGRHRLVGNSVGALHGIDIPVGTVATYEQVRPAEHRLDGNQHVEGIDVHFLPIYSLRGPAYLKAVRPLGIAARRAGDRVPLAPLQLVPVPHETLGCGAGIASTPQPGEVSHSCPKLRVLGRPKLCRVFGMRPAVGGHGSVQDCC